MKVNIIPIPTFKARILGGNYCRRLRTVDPRAVARFKDILSEKLTEIGRDPIEHYRESLNISRIIGLKPEAIKSIHVFLGLTYQLPMSLYHLYINRGYFFKMLNPYYCIGYILGDEDIDEGIHVYEAVNGTFMGCVDVEDIIEVDPSTIYVLRERIIGFSYSVIDDVVSKGIDRELLNLVREYGEENYYYLTHILIRRIASILDDKPYSSIVVGLRLKQIYRLANIAVNIFKNLVPIDRR